MLLLRKNLFLYICVRVKLNCVRENNHNKIYFLLKKVNKY